MYYHIKDRKWFDNRKQAKDHYGIACFRKLLHLKEIIFTNNTNSIANDELYRNPQINRDFQTGNSKPVDVYVWATIKCCSNHKTNISHVTEKKLSLLTGLDERTIRRVIKRLKDAGYLTVHTIIKEDADRGFIKRNSYYIKPANKDYFFLDNGFLKRTIPPRLQGFCSC